MPNRAPIIASSERDIEALRSKTMRAMRSKNTKPEMRIRSLVHSMGYRFRLHQKDLPGTPDLVFSKRRAVIFVHGCFWHGHSCARGSRQPKQNLEYWHAKIERNKDRDKRAQAALTELNWRWLIVWECELKASSLQNEIESFLGSPNGG